MNHCPCGSKEDYQDCCEQYHTQNRSPETAEKLMRARYSAFVKNHITFIGQTHIPGTKDFDLNEAQKWATESTWKGLQILQTTQGSEQDDHGVVEFKAHYADHEEKDYLHHEVSTFIKKDSVWYYKDGHIVGSAPMKRIAPKVGRNMPCPCNSGKKFKKCCGA